MTTDYLVSIRARSTRSSTRTDGSLGADNTSRSGVTTLSLHEHTDKGEDDEKLIFNVLIYDQILHI